MANKEIKAIITADASGFQRAAALAGSASKRLGAELGALQSMAAKGLGFAGLGGGAAVAGLVSMAKNAADTGDELYKMSQKTGISVEELSKLRYAAQMSGVENEVLGKSMTKLAGSIAEAATGAGPAAERFKKLGIDVRNTDGTLRGSTEVLADLADRFSEMPDGVEKTSIAVAIFGEKIGASLIPMLNGGSAGLKAMGDEAERLGIVMSTKFAKKSEEFNDNLERMKKLSEAAGISIGSSLVPKINKLLTEFLDAKESGMGFVNSLAMIGQLKGPEENLKRINAQIEKLNKDHSSGELGLFTNFFAESNKLHRLREFYEKQLKRMEGDGVKSAEQIAAERLKIAAKLSGELIKLDQLRGIESGKISADVLKDDSARTDEQIKNAEKLRDALRNAWQASVDEAKKAGEEAVKLFQKASDIRQTGADRAAAKRRNRLTPEEQQKEIAAEFEKAQHDAEFNAAAASHAATFGRTEAAAKLATQAAKDAERAANFASQLNDPEAGALAIERNAETQAQLVESQAKFKKAEQQAAEERAAGQMKTINDLDVQITALQAKAAGIKISADISNATGEIARLINDLNKLPPEKVIPIRVQQEGGVGSSSAPPAGFAFGGYTGPGSKFQPAGIVHAGEFVLRQEVVRQRGALAFLERFNRVGISALKGYATGGLVQRLQIGSLPTPVQKAQAASTVNLHLPGVGAFPAQMASDVVDELKSALAREALKRGGKK